MMTCQVRWESERSHRAERTQRLDWERNTRKPGGGRWGATQGSYGQWMR